LNKILITGANGFLGRYLVNKLSNDNFVSGLSKSQSDYTVDLSTQIPEFKEQFDTIIHCAGIAHSFPNRNLNNHIYHDVNVIGTNNLLKSLIAQLPKKFIFISSVSVYGLIEGKFINEDFPTLANDPYGKSKIDAENIIKDWCNMNNVICTILRLPLIVGDNPPGNLGSMLNAIKKGFYFNIAGGTSKKSMVLLSDIGQYILLASNAGGIFNLTDGYNPSFYELSNHFARTYKKKINFNLPFWLAKLIAKFGDYIGHKFPFNSFKLTKIINTLTFDDSKARNTFGWRPTSVLIGFEPTN
jgi:nucleoside-diphosphate-sugar epimerase